MTKFNAGDRVRAVGKVWGRQDGKEGVVTDRVGTSGRQFMRFNGSAVDWTFDKSWPIILVEAANVAQEETNEVPDAINLPRSGPTYQIVAESDFEDEVWQVLIPLGKLIISKNKQYGDAALSPRNIFSKLAPGEGIKLRMDDKLSRIERGDGTGDEDAQGDLMGYLTLLKIAERRAS